MERRGVRLTPAGAPIYYARCQHCGLMFTDAFDAWTVDDFRVHIYNDSYQRFDPDYSASRPQANAKWIARTLGTRGKALRLLDWGAGSHELEIALRQHGFGDVTAYDLIVPGLDRRPSGLFDIVSSFETLEHVPRPIEAIEAIAALLKPNAAILYSTLLQPTNIEQLGTNWWYCAPRNGHISLFTKKSLAILWSRVGLSSYHFGPSYHLAVRGKPGWLKLAVKAR
ncbi:MAG: class I SAM-dependent methyltransferase [Alphaproteobacteria bacterium]